MQTHPQQNTITDDELDLLENFIFSDAVSEESLDLIGIHGFLCSLVISPSVTPEEEWLEILFDGEPQWQNAEQQAQYHSLQLNLCLLA